MKISLITVFLLLLQISVVGQDHIIYGRVTNRDGIPIEGVTICQAKSNHCSSSLQDGMFNSVIINKYEQTLQFSLAGYKTLSISSIDTVKNFMNVRMTKDKKYESGYKQDDLPETGFISSLQVDFIFNDFDAFKPYLNEYNVDLMNKASGIISFELAGTINRYYAGLNIGYANDYSSNFDSLDIQFNTRQYGLNFGYLLVNTKRIMLMPKFAVKWNRYRLLNSRPEHSIPIGQYISERDLDIRFNQATGFVGLFLAYKVRIPGFAVNENLAFGLYGGYAFKFHNKPLIYSRGNRLTSTERLRMENYNIGIQFSFGIDGD
jgi:hypothetical protein